jgi:hypothetical protein
MTVYAPTLDFILRIVAVIGAAAVVVIFGFILWQRAQPRALYGYTFGAGVLILIARVAILALAFVAPLDQPHYTEWISPFNATATIVMIFAVALTGLFRFDSARRLRRASDDAMAGVTAQANATQDR